jgi:hypothetical protein
MRSLRSPSSCRRNKTYVHDAQFARDQELVEFFSAVLENILTVTQRIKEMLVSRLQNEHE